MDDSQEDTKNAMTIDREETTRVISTRDLLLIPVRSSEEISITIEDNESEQGYNNSSEDEYIELLDDAQKIWDTQAVCCNMNSQKLLSELLPADPIP